MADICRQGEDIAKEMREYVQCIKRELAADRLGHQEKIGELVTEVKVLTSESTNAIRAVVSDFKDCEKSRKDIHSRINKIWVTGISFLFSIIVAFVAAFGNWFKSHNGH